MKPNSPKSPLALILLMLAIACCWIFRAMADEETCPSVWVYKPYKKCATYQNGLDISRPAGPAIPVGEWSAWVAGGANQGQICQDTVEGYNLTHQKGGVFATLIKPTPVGEEQRDVGLRIIQYHYRCAFNVVKYPFRTGPNVACGVEDEWAYKVGGPRDDSLGAQTCLSCDPLLNAPPEKMASCLESNIRNIVQPRAIPLRDPDLKAMAVQVKRVIDINKITPIANLQSTENLSLFADFLKAHGGEGDGGGSGEH